MCNFPWKKHILKYKISFCYAGIQYKIPTARFLLTFNSEFCSADKKYLIIKIKGYYNMLYYIINRHLQDLVQNLQSDSLLSTAQFKGEI